MNYTELIHYINKPWASVNDIQKIALCGKNKASIIRNDIINSFLKSGKKLPQAKQKIVPMHSVIEYLGLDLNHIYLMAQKENEYIYKEVKNGNI